MRGLSREQVAEFQADGVVGPIPVLPPGEAVDLFRDLRDEVAALGVGSEASFEKRRNRHFDHPVVRRLCLDPVLANMVASVLGPDLLVWRSNLFVSDGTRGTPWHQDRYPRELAPPGTNASIHLAITEATHDNCVVVLPGSQRVAVEEMDARYGLQITEYSRYGNPRYAGVEYPPGSRRMVLQPGEMFIFDERTVHRSSTDASAPSLRVGLAIRFTTPDVLVRPSAFAETPERGHGCVLVCGRDSVGLNQLADLAP